MTCKLKRTACIIGNMIIYPFQSFVENFISLGKTLLFVIGISIAVLVTIFTVGTLHLIFFGFDDEVLVAITEDASVFDATMYTGIKSGFYLVCIGAALVAIIMLLKSSYRNAVDKCDHPKKGFE